MSVMARRNSENQLRMIDRMTNFRKECLVIFCAFITIAFFYLSSKIVKLLSQGLCKHIILIDAF